MSSGTSAVFKRSLGLMLLAGCGNLSNEDIPFIEAVPTHLAVALPLGGQAACLHPSDIAESAQATGNTLNTDLADILQLVDLVRTAPPTQRLPDGRVWGPFPDSSHPGFDIEITMNRVFVNGGDAGQVAFDYAFEEWPAGRPDAGLPILDGTFTGAQASTGRGTLNVEFENAQSLGTAKPTDPRFQLPITYDFASSPQAITLSLADAYGTIPAFSYAWNGFADGHVEFHYRDTLADGTSVDIPAFFTPLGAGSTTVTFAADAGSVAITECWDNALCISYLDDPYDATKTCASAGRCALGVPSLCPVFN